MKHRLYLRVAEWCEDVALRLRLACAKNGDERYAVSREDSPGIGGMSLPEWEQWFAFMERDANGEPFRGGFVNMNRDDGWSLTTTHSNHMKSIAMDEHGIGYL